MKHAFSLVELSIVLVILGLLTGGILGSQSLIRAAELRSINADAQRYTTAFYTFRDKYFGLPGDMSNATQFWGFSGTTAAPGCISTHGATATTAPGTCDGNGNGYMTSANAVSVTAEVFQAWNQLAQAGLIEGRYTGLSGPNTHPVSTPGQDYEYGTNSPRSRIANTGWGIFTANATGGATNVFARDYRNWLVAGTDDNAGADNPYLLPEEAWNIDTKMDDGLPAQGRVQMGIGLTTNCTNTTDTFNLSATYALSQTGLRCSLLFQ